MKRFQSLITFLKKTWQQFSDDNGFMMAGAISYFTLFSIAPLLVVIITVLSIITQSTDIENELFNQLGAIMGSDRSGELKNIVDNVKASRSGTLAAVISSVTLLISSTAVVINIKDTLNKAWNVIKDPSLGFKSMIIDRILSVGFLVGIGFIFLVSLGLNAVATVFSKHITNMIPVVSEPIIIVVSVSIGLMVSFILFYLLFRFLPDTKIHNNDLLVGAAITTILFAVGKYVIGYYLGNSDIGNTFGSAGALASFMIWVYYNAVILILGAEFTQVYAIENGRFIHPNEQSVKVERIIKKSM